MRKSATLPWLLALASITVLLAIRLGAAEAPKLEGNKERSAIDAMHGKPVPSLTLTNWINSKPLTIADLKGKIVLLDFWATWCGPCIASIPHNNELAKKYAGKVVIIGVCAPDGGEKMAATVKERHIEYPVALDVGGALFKALKGDGYPDYYIIGPDGNLLWGDVANAEVEKALDLALQKK